jgi:hypothetical protein
LMFTLLYSACAEDHPEVGYTSFDEGSHCARDRDVALICVLCTWLPSRMSIPVHDCCTDDSVLSACAVCLDDADACIKYSNVMVNSAETDPDADDDTDGRDYSAEVDKRYGTLFFGGNPWRYPSYPKPVKRYGRLFFSGKRSQSFYLPGEKRYGHLFFGGGWYGRNLPLRHGGVKGGVTGKRYGRLFMSSKDKRFGNLFMGQSRYPKYYYG